MTTTTKTPGAAKVEGDALLLQSEFAAIVREEIGMHEVFATQIAAAIVRGMRQRYGSQRIYIPSPDRGERDQAIRREFHGSNASEVCRRYSISRSRLYQIAGG